MKGRGEKVNRKKVSKMYSNYNYYPPRQQQQQPQPQIPPFLKGRPVSSLEEVRAIPIDFDGSVFYFPDIGNRRIYTKQINLDGTALINMYEFKPIPVAQESTTNTNTDAFVTREEFEETMSKIKEMFAAMPAQSPQPVQKEVTKKPAEMPKF